MSLADLITGLSILAVEGVRTWFPQPPRQVNDAQLPALYCRLPVKIDGETVTLSGDSAHKLAVDLCVILQPVGMSIQSLNWSAALAMTDAVNVALGEQNLRLGLDRWSIQVTVSDIGGETLYWMVIATVEAS